MKTTYKPLPQIASNDVTLLLGSSIGSNIDASLSHSKELVRALPAGSVLYINTVQNTRAMWESARKHGLQPSGTGTCLVDNDYHRIIYILNIPRGDLYRWRDSIKEFLHEGYIQYVVVNSWEFSSRSSRYREEAVFLIKELTDGLEGGHNPVHALIYGEETSSTPQAQKIQRNGYGKLSGLAKRIVSISIDEPFESNTAIDEIHALPEVKQMAEALDPRIGTEDEPGIDSDEALRRFLASVKMEGKGITNYELEITNEEKSEVKETIDNQPSTIDIPITSIEELRKTPETISKMPIHLNSYKPMKASVMRPKNRGNIHAGLKIK